MAEGVFVHHFITCEKLSQVDKIAQKYSVHSGGINHSGGNQSIHMLKMIKIKVILTPHKIICTLLMYRLFSNFVFISLSFQ